jgi:hypothetical protein
MNDLIPIGYTEWLESLKGRISAAHSRAAFAINAELIGLYHQIGQDILNRRKSTKAGAAR